MTGNTSIWDDIKHQYQYGGMVTKLVLINIGVFIAEKLLYIPLWLSGKIEWYAEAMNWLYVPASLKQLILQPWTLLTYQFLHDGFLHILFNMLWLFYFGRIFSEFQNSKKVLPIYLYGGFAGAALYLLSYNIFPVFQDQLSMAFMLGASASVLSIVFATATLLPNYQIQLLLIGPVRIKYVAAVPLLISILTIPDGNAGGNIAHIGGAAFGFLYARNLSRGFDMSTGFYNAIEKLSILFNNQGQNSGKSKSKVKIVHSESNKKLRRRYSEVEQDKIDEILDKISITGYESLTKQEKDYLFRASKEEHDQ